MRRPLPVFLTFNPSLPTKSSGSSLSPPEFPLDLRQREKERERERERERETMFTMQSEWD